MSNTIILCRGESLKNIKNLNPHDFDKTIIVNNFENESQNIDIRNFLLNSKEIIQYVGRDIQSITSNKFYKYFNIKNVVLNVLEKEFKGIGPYKGIPQNKKILDRFGINNSFLNNEIVKYSLDKDNPNNLRQPSFPTTGILCLVDQIINHDSSNITVIGMDFYEKNYFTNHNVTNTKNVTKNHKIKGGKMKLFLNDFYLNFCLNNNITINLVTESSFTL